MIDTRKRTDVDFSKHELYVTDKDGVLIHHLKLPDHGIAYSIKFINIDNMLIVNGDYGRWSFCREFHPSEDGYVSSGYWIEKLETYSTQSGYEFDEESTKEEIEDGIESELEKYGFEGEELDQMKEYFQELLEYVECGDNSYSYFAFNNYPHFTDHEIVPYVKKTKHRLNIVFDAFEEICKRLKEK